MDFWYVGNIIDAKFLNFKDDGVKYIVGTWWQLHIH